MTSSNLDISENTDLLKRRSVSGAVALLIAQALKFILQFGSQLLLARLLDPGQFGLVAMTAPIIGFVQIINDLGLSQAVVQRVGITPKQISALFWINSAISTGLMVLVVVSAPAFAWLYGEPQVTNVIVVLAGLIVLGGISLVPSAILARRMQFIPMAFIDVLGLAAGVSVAVFSAYEGFGFWALVFAQVATSITTSVATWHFARWRPLRPARANGIGSMLSFGAHLTGANLANYVTTSVDRMIIATVVGKIELGLYDRSYRIVILPLTQMLAPVGRVALPLLSQLKTTPDRLSRTYLIMVQLALLVTVPGLLVSVHFSSPIIALVFGEQWREAGPIFGWICIGGFASALYTSASWLFITENHTRMQMRATTCVSIINIAGFTLGVHWGAVGVACVGAISFVLLQTPLMLWAATRKSSVAGWILVKTIIPFVIAGVLVEGGFYLAIGKPHTLTLFKLALYEGVSYAGYSLCLVFLPGGGKFLGNFIQLGKSLGFRRTYCNASHLPGSTPSAS